MGRASIAYSSRDYESLRRELLARVPQLTDRWTDFNASDIGVVLLELFCGVGDMLTYYLDAQAAEAFLPTARQRQNVMNLCKLIGYRLDRPVAATTTLRFRRLASTLESDLVIPAGTACRALLEDGVVDFETAVDVIIPRGVLEVEVGARQGERRTELLMSAGTPWQRLPLTGQAIAQDSLRVRVGNDVWSEVADFQESDATSLHFLAETDGLDVTSISFGDGARGAIPLAGATIEVSYLVTLGARGNLGPGLVTQVLTPLYLNGALVSLTVTNSSPATGGADRESLDQARRQAPAELRTIWKAVTKEDYKALAEGFPGVAKAQVLDANDCPTIRYYSVQLAIAPRGGGLPSPLLKAELASFLEARKVVTVELNLADPVYKEIHLGAEVYAFAVEDLALVRSRIEAALADFFAFDRVAFGQAVHVSDLVALLDGVRGVSYMRLFTPQVDVILRPGEIPVLGNVQLDLKRAEL